RSRGAAFRAFDRSRARASGTRSLLICSVSQSSRHRIADSKAGAEARAQPGSTGWILGRISHRIRSLELSVTINVPNYYHRSPLVHCGLNFGRQRDILDDKLGEIEAECLEILIQLTAQHATQFIVVCRKVQRSNL